MFPTPTVSGNRILLVAIMYIEYLNSIFYSIYSIKKQLTKNGKANIKIRQWTHISQYTVTTMHRKYLLAAYKLKKELASKILSSD